MMLLIESMNESMMALPTYLAAPSAGSGEGVFGWIDSLASDARSSFKNLAYAGIFLGMLIGLIAARGKVAASLITFAVAAFLWWAVGNFNDNSVSDKIGDEFAAPTVIVDEVPDLGGGTSSA